MSPAQMRGRRWAGEIVPPQFMPSSYLQIPPSISTGDGRRASFTDTAEILASTANFY